MQPHDCATAPEHPSPLPLPVPHLIIVQLDPKNLHVPAAVALRCAPCFTSDRADTKARVVKVSPTSDTHVDVRPLAAHDTLAPLHTSLLMCRVYAVIAACCVLGAF